MHYIVLRVLLFIPCVIAALMFTFSMIFLHCQPYNTYQHDYTQPSLCDINVAEGFITSFVISQLPLNINASYELIVLATYEKTKTCPITIGYFDSFDDANNTYIDLFQNTFVPIYFNGIGSFCTMQGTPYKPVVIVGIIFIVFIGTILTMLLIPALIMVCSKKENTSDKEEYVIANVKINSNQSTCNDTNTTEESTL